MPALGRRFLKTFAYAAPALLVIDLAAIGFAEDQEQVIQCKKLPAAVRAAFEKTYPMATIKSCAKETERGKVAYEIASVDGNKRRDVLYYFSGKLIVVEETISIRNLPARVKQAVDRKFPEGAIVLAEKLTRGSSISYEFQIRHKGKTVEIAFDPRGKEVEQ